MPNWKRTFAILRLLTCQCFSARRRRALNRDGRDPADDDAHLRMESAVDGTTTTTSPPPPPPPPPPLPSDRARKSSSLRRSRSAEVEMDGREKVVRDILL